MKHFQQAAMILHTRPYTESSLLLDVFVRDHGRLMLLSKGARRQKASMRGVLMPFQPLLISWSSRNQLGILMNAEVSGFRPLPRGEALQSCYYMNELILKLLHRFDPHPTLYDNYHATVEKLVSTEDDQAELLRVFEKKLLQEIGFGLILDYDYETGEMIDESREYQYIANQGPALNVGASDSSVHVSGKTLRALAMESIIHPVVKRQARKLTRTLIQHQLGTKQLRTRRVMMAMRGYAEGAKVSSTDDQQRKRVNQS
ncbi:MAG: DNA repair protein RecO [Acidiferrobacterales bacterium]|nr:DNA repair protein RecO [Acidiferrobacterales bacterium]